MGNLFNHHRQMMSTLLYLDTLRGEDSTGVSCVRGNGDVDTLKLTVPGYDFVRLQKFDQMLRTTDLVWLGHNRFKTTGLVNRLNAHPFEVTDKDGDTVLVGAHNGTLTNKWDLPREKEFGTDSECLLNMIAEMGPKDAIAKARGAWSLVWYDVFEETVNFLRNKERPMCYAFSENQEQFFWASEADMLKFAADRHNVKLMPTSKDGTGCVWFPNEDVWIKVKVPRPGKDRKIPEPTWEGGLEGCPAPKNNFQGSTPYYGAGNYRQRPKNDPLDDWDENELYGGGWPIAARSVSKDKETTKEGGPKGGQEEPSRIIGFEGRELNGQEAAEIAKMGCGWCGDPLDIKNPYAFLDDDAMCCHRCIRDLHPMLIGEAKNEPEDEKPLRLPPPVHGLSERQEAALAELKKKKDALGNKIDVAIDKVAQARTGGK